MTIKDKKKTEAISTGEELVRLDPLQSYMQEVMNYPMLTADEELELARKFHEDGDIEAAKKLVATHLKLVAKIAFIKSSWRCRGLI